MTLAVVGLLVPLLAAWVWLFTPRQDASGGDGIVRLASAFGVGLGASSITTLWLVLAGVTLGPRFVVVDLVLWTAILGAGIWRLRKRNDVLSYAFEPPRHRPRSTSVKLARVAFFIVACLAVATMAREYQTSPHGEWDAWAIWNQKARFLVRGGARWTDQLSIIWSNPSHPLLLPLSVARLWTYSDSETTVVPALLAALCGAGSVAMVMGALGLGRSRAWIAGAVLLAPGLFLQQVMTQQADAPVAFFLVSALVMLAKQDGPACLVAGALVGFAGWTKNEGLLFAAAMAPVLLWIAIRRWTVRPVLWWLLGAAPVVLTIVWFKTYVAPVPAPYFEGPQTVSSILGRITASGRHAIIVPLVAQGAMDWGGPRAAGVVLVALAGSMVASIRDAEAGRVLAVLAFVALGYYGVYLLSPLDAAWLVRTTFYRMLTQLWPSLVLLAFGGPCVRGAYRSAPTAADA